MTVDERDRQFCGEGSALTDSLLETARDMRDAGILDVAAHDKITLRHMGKLKRPGQDILSGEDIRVLRETARLSQAVFANYLNVTPGYVSQLERGIRRPTGAALALLNVIRRKGIAVVQ
jgi:putative transcriptional regulator